MKSERRHELEQNELADWTVQAAEKVKPYANVILVGVIAIVILAVGLTLLIKQKEQQSNDSWHLYHAAINLSNPTLLEDVVEMYPDSGAAQWANAFKGDLHLSDGCNELFSDKANANQELDEAIKSYKTIENSTNPFIKARAAFGLAHAYEAKGDLDKAKAAYEKVTKQKGSPYIEIAKSRLIDLEKPSTLAFYDLFAKYEPKPAFSAGTTPTTELPAFESTDVPAPEEKASEAKPVEEKKEEK